MSRLFKLFSFVLISVFSSLTPNQSLAWDSVGHRLSAAIATQFLSPETKAELLQILRQHPRYQQDFIEQMPASIALGNEDNRFNWLLGQAAFWPDITRSLPESERDKYNRANWHYIDGAWLRGQANVQGNTYINLGSFDDIAGQRAANIRSETDIDNVMNALDFNTILLANERASASQRAVALCWVLHLIGDIHQPLHVGSLYSANRFSTGDRGGNGIATDDRNLHSRWDRALSNESVNSNLENVLEQHATLLQRMDEEDADDWSLWMQESRALLLNTVYTEQMKSTVARTDDSNEQLPQFDLDADYVQTMQYHSRLRLALAGRRIAIWFENHL